MPVTLLTLYNAWNQPHTGVHCEDSQCSVPSHAVDLRNSGRMHDVYYDPKEGRIIKASAAYTRDTGQWQNEVELATWMGELGIGPKVYESGVERAPWWPSHRRRPRGIFTMQALERTLRDVDVFTPAIVDSVVDLISRVADMHIMYSDMKGNNIMLDDSNQAFFIDFGDNFVIRETNVDPDVLELVMLIVLRSDMHRKRRIDLFADVLPEFPSRELRDAAIDYIAHTDRYGGANPVYVNLMRMGGFMEHDINLMDFLNDWKRTPSLEWPLPLYKHYK